MAKCAGKRVGTGRAAVAAKAAKAETAAKAGAAKAGAAKAGAVEPEGTKTEKPLRPGQCRAYIRRRLAVEFPGIVDGFLKGAQSGSCQHVKLATELLASRPRQKAAVPAGKATISRWADEMERGE